MDEQELQHLLRENNRILKENNRLLVAMHKYQRFQKITRALYWAVTIAIALGAYYYAKPYIDRVYSTYQSVYGTVTGIQNFFGTSNSQ